MGKTLKEMDLNLSFDLRVEPLNHYKLDAATTQRLREGDIVALDDQYTFIQRIPRSHYVGGWPGSLSLFPASNATAGYRLNGAHCLFSRLSCVYLDAPALARNAQARTAAQRFGEGHLTERLHFDNGSSFERLGVAFNQMADNINALIASKNS